MVTRRRISTPVALRQQVQRGIEPMQAVVTAPRAAQTHNLHRAGGRFGVAFVLARLRALDTAGVLGRTSSLFRAAMVAMSLQELAHQLLAPPVQSPFEFALAHLPGFAGREEGFGIREDSIGRCARGSPRGIDARDAGSGQRRMYVAGILSSQPSQVCLPSHGTVPERRANVQKGARLSGRRPKVFGAVTRLGWLPKRRRYALACLMSLPKWPLGRRIRGQKSP